MGERSAESPVWFGATPTVALCGEQRGRREDLYRQDERLGGGCLDGEQRDRGVHTEVDRDRCRDPGDDRADRRAESTEKVRATTRARSAP
ncbi:hypothetical protein AB0F59_27970 [Micromonospora lupini]|uniref:hypothetical protein n=1 Tax=Micromonospora lupini TaxID=285679 RepID=UPI0033DCBE11